MEWVPATVEEAWSWLKRDAHPLGPILARGWVFQNLTSTVLKELVARGYKQVMSMLPTDPIARAVARGLRPREKPYPCVLLEARLK